MGQFYAAKSLLLLPWLWEEPDNSLLTFYLELFCLLSWFNWI